MYMYITRERAWCSGGSEWKHLCVPGARQRVGVCAGVDKWGTRVEWRLPDNASTIAALR